MNKGIFLCHDFVLGFCFFAWGGRYIWNFFVCFVGVWDILRCEVFYVWLVLLLNTLLCVGLKAGLQTQNVPYA